LIKQSYPFFSEGKMEQKFKWVPQGKKIRGWFFNHKNNKQCAEALKQNNETR
jgi:hypothetical protein